MSLRNYRIRALLYAGKPNWSPLAIITPLKSGGPDCRGAADRTRSAGIPGYLFTLE
jgi:hypothetical protein